MSYRRQDSETSIVLSPTSAPHTASVIWMHGLGADGSDFVPLVPELRLPSTSGVRFIFPHAPVRPVTLNNGFPMRAWYDIRSLSAEGREDAAGIRESELEIMRLIRVERDSGIAAERIVLAGFSQGGAVALHAALRHTERLGGILALSTYLTLRASLAAEAHEANRATPIFMCHGEYDGVVTIDFGRQSRDALRALGYDVTWKEYPMQHEVCRQEIDDIAAWMRTRLPPPG